MKRPDASVSLSVHTCWQGAVAQPPGLLVPGGTKMQRPVCTGTAVSAVSPGNLALQPPQKPSGKTTRQQAARAPPSRQGPAHGGKSKHKNPAHQCLARPLRSQTQLYTKHNERLGCSKHSVSAQKLRNLKITFLKEPKSRFHRIIKEEKLQAEARELPCSAANPNVSWLRSAGGTGALPQHGHSRGQLHTKPCWGSARAGHWLRTNEQAPGAPGHPHAAHPGAAEGRQSLGDTRDLTTAHRRLHMRSWAALAMVTSWLQHAAQRSAFQQTAEVSRHTLGVL